MSIHNIPYQYMKEITLSYYKSVAIVFFKGLKDEFEIAVVKEPPVLEPLKFYCIFLNIRGHLRYQCSRSRELIFIYFHRCLVNGLLIT